MRALETERLVLRPHEAGDFEEGAAMWADPVVTRHIGGKPSTREEAWARLMRYVGHWPVVGYGYWAVRERSSGKFVGDVGFADMKRDLVPSFGDAPEAGWVLATWAHGKGYATEAMHAAIGWLENARGKERTFCMIDIGNAASIRVAEKCGYREWTRTTYKGTPVILFERVA